MPDLGFVAGLVAGFALGCLTVTLIVFALYALGDDDEPEHRTW